MQQSQTEEAINAAQEPQALPDISMAMQPAPHIPDAFLIPQAMLEALLTAGSQLPSGRTDPQHVPNGASRDPVLFDRWLRRELGRVHDDVLREPIPDRLRLIIEGGRSPDK